LGRFRCCRPILLVSVDENEKKKKALELPPKRFVAQKNYRQDIPKCFRHARCNGRRRISASEKKKSDRVGRSESCGLKFDDAGRAQSDHRWHGLPRSSTASAHFSALASSSRSSGKLSAQIAFDRSSLIAKEVMPKLRGEKNSRSI